MEGYCCRTISLSPVTPVMRSCVGIIRRSFCWPTATCSESRCRKTMCSPAWMPLDGSTVYSIDEMSWLNHTKHTFFCTLFFGGFFKLVFVKNCVCEFAWFQLWQRHADPKQYRCSLQWRAVWGLHGDERSPLLALCHTAVKAGSGPPTNLEGRHRPGCTLLPAGLPGNNTGQPPAKYKQSLSYSS